MRISFKTLVFLAFIQSSGAFAHFGHSHSHGPQTDNPQSTDATHLVEKGMDLVGVGHNIFGILHSASTVAKYRRTQNPSWGQCVIAAWNLVELGLHGVNAMEFGASFADLHGYLPEYLSKKAKYIASWTYSLNVLAIMNHIFTPIVFKRKGIEHLLTLHSIGDSLGHVHDIWTTYDLRAEAIKAEKTLAEETNKTAPCEEDHDHSTHQVDAEVHSHDDL